MRKQILLRDEKGNQFIDGMPSTLENTNFLLDYDTIKMFKWKSNSFDDKLLITEARRVLNHEYLLPIPSSSSKYYGFLIRKLEFAEKKYP